MASEPDTLFSSASPFEQIDLSNDGAWIAYRTTAPRENLFVMRADGTGRRRLTDDAARNRGPMWIGNDEWIVFYSNRSGEYQLWLVRRDGTDLRQLANTSGAGVNLPHVSRDGSRVAMSLHPKTGPSQFASASVDASWFGAETPTLNLEMEPAAGAFFPSGWSPDGTRIAGQRIDPRGNEPAIYTLDADRLEPQRDRGGRDFGSWDAGAVWLPDGRRILSWDIQRNAAVLWDTVALEVRDVPGIPGPSELDLSVDGRTLVVSRQIAEGDIWLLTLE